MPFNIALDGPVGAGKSTISDAVAERLSILHLDTGAMYRAVGLSALRLGINPDDEQAITKMAEKLVVDVRYESGTQRTLLCGEDVTDLLHTTKVSAAASSAARWPGVRRKMVQAQQKLAEEHYMLIDGRDIGTRVLPKAKVKIFLTATPEERARRRQAQLKEQGKDLAYETVLADLLARDRQDIQRETDPLRQAPDAVLVDSTDLSQEETVDAILKIVRENNGEAS